MPYGFTHPFHNNLNGLYNQLPYAGYVRPGVPVCGNQPGLLNPAGSALHVNGSYPQRHIAPGGGVAYAGSTEWTGIPPYVAQPRAPVYQHGTVQHKLKSQGVPTKTIELALQGEYISLHEFLAPIGAAHNLTETELEPVLDVDSIVHYRPKKYTRKITNFETWSQAWAAYEQLIINVLGVVFQQPMSDYRLFIQEQKQKYAWSAVAIYDYKHRSRLATLPNFFDRMQFDMPSTFRNSVLDATAMKQNAQRCSRCKGYDHVVANCPFPEAPSRAPQAKTQASASVSQEICNNYNRERCSNTNCRRKHICRTCRGPLPQAKCQVSGPCANRGEGTTQI